MGKVDHGTQFDVAGLGRGDCADANELCQVTERHYGIQGVVRIVGKEIRLYLTVFYGQLEAIVSVLNERPEVRQYHVGFKGDDTRVGAVLALVFAQSEVWHAYETVGLEDILLRQPDVVLRMQADSAPNIRLA